ncbi:chromate transporter [Thermomonospora echinospora]|uniref:Chromate transporter n=1 Tax=Thermomonospora echinospora TaxID=1992 RepID=A0A1H6DF15_9ACTN|nr:chromate efflux transporter [Thermomonospora echinospora]SEG83978.1 chromate transporter [Thermomonospora echinospora]
MTTSPGPEHGPGSGEGPDSGHGRERPARPLRELAALFLKLGVIGFGGPAAHIAMMHEEVVRRRRWVDERRFVDLIGAVSLIPGPNSTELAIHLGYERGRWRGLLVAGVCFIVPAVVMVSTLAWAYVRYGSTPEAEGLLYGIKPVVVGIIAWALVGLLRTAVRGPLLWCVALAALAAYLAGANELAVLAAGGLAVTAWRTAARLRDGRAAVLPLLLAAPHDERLPQLFWTMLKIGSVLYGSGYVLLAFLRGDFVERLGWLTEQQLLDAVSIGQVTPGPLFTTATFVGYLAAGWPGAVLATVGIFLPSFALVALLTRLAARMRSARWSAALLDGVNATALALMAGVSYQLGREALVDPLTVVLAVATVLLLWRVRLNSAWLIGVGGAIGLAVRML